MAMHFYYLVDSPIGKNTIFFAGNVKMNLSKKNCIKVENAILTEVKRLRKEKCCTKKRHNVKHKKIYTVPKHFTAQNFKLYCIIN